MVHNKVHSRLHLLDRRTSSLSGKIIRQLSAALDVLVCHGVRVDVHGDVAIDHITRPRRLGGLSEAVPPAR